MLLNEMQFLFLYAEAVLQRCSVKKVFLEISQDSQENTCVRVSFSIKLCHVSLFHLSQSPFFFIEHLWWLLLSMLFRANLFQVKLDNISFLFKFNLTSH